MNNLLVDTHVLLWALSSPDNLSPRARAALVDPDNEVFVSAATAWEISIKSAIGKLRAPSDLEQQVRRLRFRPMPITFEHGAAVRDLPMLHRDPFDRMLIAQAKAHGLTLVTSDKAIMQYDITTLAA
jgi:PIN domain nuclease of toxin-antitoxin system